MDGQGFCISYSTVSTWVMLRRQHHGTGRNDSRDPFKYTISFDFQSDEAASEQVLVAEA